MAENFAPLLSTRAVAPVIEAAGDVLTLHYATPADLAAVGPVLAADLVVQVRHAPGAAVPEIGPNTAPAAGLHPLLQRWAQ